MSDKTNIFGCFVSGPSLYGNATPKQEELANQQGDLFSAFIWGEYGVDQKLKILNHADYGRDLILVLFQFELNPIPFLLEHLKEIESYRKKEKSIGIPIIVNNENFFDKSDIERRRFLRDAILKKMELLDAVVKKKKLDTNMEKLKVDLEGVLATFV